MNFRYKSKQRQYQHDVTISHGYVLIRSTYFFVKGTELTEAKPFFHGISSQHTMYIWESRTKQQKTTITSNNKFLLMLGEFKSDQSDQPRKEFVCGKSETSLMTQVSNKLCTASKFRNNKRKQLFQILTIH